MVYGEPETAQFLAAVQRLRRRQRQKERLVQKVRERLRSVLRKLRPD